MWYNGIYLPWFSIGSKFFKSRNHVFTSISFIHKLSAYHELDFILIIGVIAEHEGTVRDTVPTFIFVFLSLCSALWTYYRNTEYVFVKANNDSVLFLQHFYTYFYGYNFFLCFQCICFSMLIGVIKKTRVIIHTCINLRITAKCNSYFIWLSGFQSHLSC